jgi:hypothetical protein
MRKGPRVYTDSGASAVLLLVSILLSWLVIYTAVRAGSDTPLTARNPG